MLIGLLLYSMLILITALWLIADNCELSPFSLPIIPVAVALVGGYWAIDEMRIWYRDNK